MMINFTANEIEDSLRVVADFIGKKGVTVVYHDKPEVYANIETKTIYIPRTGTLDYNTLMMLRGKVYHEAGHCSETKLPANQTPKGVKFKILNSVEDRRMEHVLREEYRGADPVFDHMIHELNKEYGISIERAKKDPNFKGNPVMESLAAMSFKYEGLVPSWNVSPEAEEYIDKCYQEFSKTRVAKNTSDAKEVAENIYKIMKEMNQSPPQEGEEENENNQGGSGQEGEKDDNEEGGASSQGGDSDDSDDSEGSEGENEGGSEGDNSEEDEEGNGNSKGESSSNEGENSEGSGDGNKPENGELEEGEGKEEGNEKGKGKNNGKESGGKRPSRQKYKPTEEDVDGDLYDDVTLEQLLEEQSKGPQLDDVADEAIKDLLKNIPCADKQYTCKRENDDHIIPEINDRERKVYRERREKVAADIMAMSRYLEQALRSLAMIQKHPYMTRGKIDPRKYTAIAKSLSKHVFYTTDPGSSINTAVSIVIDESGSMGEWLEIQLLAMALGETLSAIKVPFEIIGGTTKYWSSSYQIPSKDGFTRTNPIVYFHYKNFEEDWMFVKERITTSAARKHYVDGEMVEYASMRLTTRPEMRKIIFSLSDGCPDAGQGGYSNFSSNLKRVCSKCRSNGIEVYGFGIGTEEPKTFYGEENFIYLERRGKMGQTFYRKMVDILTKGTIKIR